MSRTTACTPSNYFPIHFVLDKGDSEKTPSDVPMEKSRQSFLVVTLSTIEVVLMYEWHFSARNVFCAMGLLNPLIQSSEIDYVFGVIFVV